MSSKIEQQIDQIEDYIDSCRYQKFSKTNIIVDKDELDGLLEELRARTPEEIKHYQRIISNKEAILEDARRKAEELINEAPAAGPGDRRPRSGGSHCLQVLCLPVYG